MMNAMIRSLPNFKGKLRLIRFLFGKHISCKRNVSVNGKFGLKYRLPTVIDSIGVGIYINGVYEPDISKLIISKLPARGVYLDIGANIGSIAMPVCKKRPDVTAICVEASPKIFDSLSFNFKENNLSNCILLNKAVSDEDGEALFYMNDNEDYFGQGHISNTKSEKSETVISSKIDTLLSQVNVKTVNVLKVDIEGYEYFAFKGAEKLLTAANAPDIIFEFEDWAERRIKNLQAGDAQKLLLQYGYSLYHLQKNNRIKYLDAPILKGSAMIMAKKTR
jgi:FkbM family methyltransferase